MAQNPSHRSELKGAFQDAWNDLVARSEEEPDVALIAAYVDGQLNEAETHRLGCHTCDCPVAWEILENMLPEGQPLPVFAEDEAAAEEITGAQATVSFADRTDETTLPDRTTRRSWQLALAAGWLLAVVCGAWLWFADVPGLKTRMARMEEQQRATAYQLAQAEVGELAQSAGGFGRVYAIGDPTAGMVRAATRPQARGPDELSDDARKQIDTKLASIREAVADAEVPNAPEDNLPLRLIEVSGLIMAGRLDEADSLLLELENRFPGNKVRNARAVWQIDAAQEASVEKARALKARAERTLREIAPEGPPEAWLNLALYYMAEGDAGNAVSAAEEYLQTSPDAVVAEIVRQEFSLQGEDAR